MKKVDFLLEINVEELPVAYVRPALKSMRQAFHHELESHRINYERVKAEDLGTKNKLICYIEGVSLQQEEVSREIIGPPKRIAFDEKGKPTRQAIGFAQNQGVKPEDLRIKNTPRGEYVVVEKKEKPRNTKAILQQIIPDIIKDIKFQKTMRWDDSGLHFARPIESVLYLLGREKIDIKVGNVEQNNKVKSIEPVQYLKRIKKECIIDSDERRDKIKNLILKKIKNLDADQRIDPNLLEEVTFMVNSPNAFTGEFNKKFLALPEDVLKASMAKHQRIFPVSKKGRLINKFVAVIENGFRRNIKAIRKNYENILEAKLQDSLFFYNEDTRGHFSENISQLKDLIFQRGLGNMFEKIQRLKGLCLFVCKKIGQEGSLKIDTERAAELSKIDLVTHMVGEFPSLQGVMGALYALKSGENKEVAVAIREHYLPRGMDDNLPVSLAGAVLAITDKIDNVVGFLGTGAEISGSFDPFGIRRNAQGLIQIIRDRSLRFSIDELIQRAIELYGGKLKGSGEELRRKILGYISERIDFLAGDIRPIELKKAVLAVGCADIVDAFKRIAELSSISSEKYFLEAAKVVERTSNILKGAKKEHIGEVDERLLKEDLERAVWKTYLDSRHKIQGLIDRGQYKEATRAYAEAFYKALHEFFDKVLVNVEDKTLRLNRLALMNAVNRLYTERVADLAMLPQIVVK